MTVNIDMNNNMNILLDNGLPTRLFIDYVESHYNYIDNVKFGWGTAVVTNDLQIKISTLIEYNIAFFFGGTLFEKAVIDDKVSDFHKLCEDNECPIVEISNGTINLSNEEKGKYIKDFSSEFIVYSEVGYKDSWKSDSLSNNKWLEYINQDFDMGASKVIVEARESGNSGICSDNGEVKKDTVQTLIESNIEINNLIFEAPNKNLQTYFITSINNEVNLSNIAFNDLIPLVTLRMGLRSDTLNSDISFMDIQKRSRK
ncbi:phosphosulfolactate synthase [Salibacterium salarium]|uniref:phosphosulfolactate synthase n=1 Tax=Salibacterium salarium TaxID=284579 RepID=UPI002786E669|nr:phosphosulfolactate synthase [Salibacterium salarium]MDQ0298228.1 phosphosulfolactate synthase [Salibacterium salarium]